MAQKAKQNIVCGDERFESGKVYSEDAVKHLDQNDFIQVDDSLLDSTEEKKSDGSTQTEGSSQATSAEGANTNDLEILG